MRRSQTVTVGQQVTTIHPSVRRSIRAPRPMIFCVLRRCIYVSSWTDGRTRVLYVQASRISFIFLQILARRSNLSARTVNFIICRKTPCTIPATLSQKSDDTRSVSPPMGGAMCFLRGKRALSVGVCKWIEGRGEDGRTRAQHCSTFLQAFDANTPEKEGKNEAARL